jgi:DNA-binding phage protein
MLINEEEDGKSYTEVAVVDNPLYAENEGEVESYLKETLATEQDEDIIEVQHSIARSANHEQVAIDQ